MTDATTMNVWDGTERRRWPRYLAASNVRLRRTKPTLPTIQNVYTKDLSSFGACFSVTDSIVFSANDEVRAVFVIRINEKVTKLHFRLCRVAWSRNGRVGVQFKHDAQGKPLR